MSENLFVALAFSCTLGSCLIAGVFFAFSTFVMRALDRLPPKDAIAGMNHINITVINPFFMFAFMGTAALCVALCVVSIIRWSDGGPYAIAGAITYVIGTILVTMAFNVPRNDALARVQPTDPDQESTWRSYSTTWTAWNHVRTIAPLGASALLMAALLVD